MTKAMHVTATKQRKRSKKGTVSVGQVLGLIFKGIGVFCILLTLCIDYDVSDSVAVAFQAQVKLAAISIVSFLLDFVVSDTRRVKRVIFPAGVVILAWIYSILHRIMSFPRYCYLIKKKCGTYRETYGQCQDIFDEEYGYPYDL